MHCFYENPKHLLDTRNENEDEAENWAKGRKGSQVTDRPLLRHNARTIANQTVCSSSISLEYLTHILYFLHVFPWHRQRTVRMIHLQQNFLALYQIIFTSTKTNLIQVNNLHIS